MSLFNIRGVTVGGIAVTGFPYHRHGHAGQSQDMAPEMRDQLVRAKNSFRGCVQCKSIPSFKQTDFQIIEAKVLGRWAANAEFPLTDRASIVCKVYKSRTRMSGIPIAMSLNFSTTSTACFVTNHRNPKLAVLTSQPQNLLSWQIFAVPSRQDLLTFPILKTSKKSSSRKVK
jgi:hypothetical protein